MIVYVVFTISNENGKEEFQTIAKTERGAQESVRLLKTFLSCDVIYRSYEIEDF
jgi:hypothetical protein